MIMSEFQSTKIFLLKDILLVSDLNGEEIVGSFYKKELRKSNQKEFRI